MEGWKGSLAALEEDRRREYMDSSCQNSKPIDGQTMIEFGRGFTNLKSSDSNSGIVVIALTIVRQFDNLAPRTDNFFNRVNPVNGVRSDMKLKLRLSTLTLGTNSERF